MPAAAAALQVPETRVLFAGTKVLALLVQKKAAVPAAAVALQVPETQLRAVCWYKSTCFPGTKKKD
jgi:hypothetical protein